MVIKFIKNYIETEQREKITGVTYNIFYFGLQEKFCAFQA